MTRRRRGINEHAQAVEHLRAGGRPEAVPAHVRADAWRASGGVLYRAVGDWLLPAQAPGDGWQVLARIHGLPTLIRRPGRITPHLVAPLRRYNGPPDAPKHSLPHGGTETVAVSTDGRVHRGLYWTGSWHGAAEDTGDTVAMRAAAVERERCTACHGTGTADLSTNGAACRYCTGTGKRKATA